MIPFFRPHLAGEEGKLVREVLLSGFLNDGPMTARFEDDLANFIGVRHVVCTTSGTAALYLALRAAGVGPGESVVVPDLTFMATASAAKMTGAEVLLAEVGEDLAIDHLTTEHLPARTVVPVHVSGRSARTDYPCTVIEDSCEAFPMKPTGLAACYSFSPLKLITTGQGGAVATDDEDFASRVRALKDHGRLERDSGDFPTVGFNFKFT
ncbi:MAG: DegT/DnrJ/EryC1/StrS aminotransferase family protein, partial [Euryarchaeota archaeon]|nr:DegT/DnrJ/EryC1/StrS aminotransferase family protein [Euryarchaeota archaeon]